MNRNCVLSLVCFSISFFEYSCSASRYVQVKSPGENEDIQPALQAAVDKAVNGDQLVLPVGIFVINKSVVIKKFLSLKGQGLKKTILYRSESVPDSILSKREWRCMINYDIKSDVPSNIVIADIGFRSRKAMVVEGESGSSAPSEGIRMVQCVDFLIEHCRFEYFANAGVTVIHKDTLARGLIRNNEFYYNAGAGLGYGVVVYGGNKQWVTDPKFGSSNFIFVEDNIFDFHRHSIAANDCALFVFRYNTVLNNIAASGGHAIDTHEARGKPFGTRAVEVYNNKLLNTTYTDSTPIIAGVKTSPSGASLESAGVAIRNGDAVVFNNDVRGYTYAVSVSNWYLGRTVQPYPVAYGPGYVSALTLGPGHSGISPPESDGDAFFWNNTGRPYVSGPTDTSSVFHNYQPDWWKEGRDYHLVAKPGYKPYPYPLKKIKNRKTLLRMRSSNS